MQIQSLAPCQRPAGVRPRSPTPAASRTFTFGVKGGSGGESPARARGEQRAASDSGHSPACRCSPCSRPGPARGAVAGRGSLLPVCPSIRLSVRAGRLRAPDARLGGRASAGLPGGGGGAASGEPPPGPARPGPLLPRSLRQLGRPRASAGGCALLVVPSGLPPRGGPRAGRGPGEAAGCPLLAGMMAARPAGARAPSFWVGAAAAGSGGREGRGPQTPTPTTIPTPRGRAGQGRLLPLCAAGKKPRGSEGARLARLAALLPCRPFFARPPPLFPPFSFFLINV